MSETIDLEHQVYNLEEEKEKAILEAINIEKMTNNFIASVTERLSKFANAPAPDDFIDEARNAGDGIVSLIQNEYDFRI